MRTYNVFVHYTARYERIPIKIDGEQKIGDIVEYLKDYLKLGASYGGTEARTLVLQYAGADLNENWVFDDLNIVTGSTIKCILKEEKVPDYSIYIKFRKDYYKYYDDALNVSEFKVYDLRVKLSEAIGLPLSVFRLKVDTVEMLDDHRLIDYGVQRYSTMILETWIGWDSFLNNCIKGYSKQAIKSMSSDEIVRQYQSKVALFIAAHYGNTDLANIMMNSGARPNVPVGEHPSRRWCSLDSASKPEYLKCPIHEAVQNGHLKIISLFSKDALWILEQKDGFGIPPWRLALKNINKNSANNHNIKEVARFLLAKQFSGKIKISPTCSISIQLYGNLRKWLDKARQKVLLIHGFSRTSYKRRPFHKGALLGYKVLVDGYNNNFKDYPNTYDEMKAKNESCYFVDEEEKRKRANPETYFRTLAAVDSLASFNSHSFGSLKTQSLSNFTKIADKVINHNILNRNSKQLAQMGYEMDTFRNNHDDQLTHKGTPGGILHRVRNQIAKEESEKKPDKKHTRIPNKLPIINEKALKSISTTDLRQPSIISKITIKSDPGPKQNIPFAFSNSTSTVSFNYVPVNMMQSLTPDLFAEKLNNNNNNINKSSKSSHLSETMKCYLKYCDGQTPKDIAEKCVKDANQFSGKTWLKQIQIGTRMVQGQAKRRIQNLVKL